MKTYKFPYGGAEWDSFVEFELTDEEAVGIKEVSDSWFFHMLSYFDI